MLAESRGWVLSIITPALDQVFIDQWIIAQVCVGIQTTSTLIAYIFSSRQASISCQRWLYLYSFQSKEEENKRMLFFWIVGLIASVNTSVGHH
jgi:hypothetical protein